MTQAVARRRAVALAALGVGIGAPLAAAHGQAAGDGFLFRRPRGALAVRVGYDQALARSDFFRDATDRLTLTRRGFGGPAVAADVAFGLGGRLDLAISGGVARSVQDSEYRDFVGVDDLPIAQRTTFTRVPVTAALRYYLAPRGEQVGRFAWVPGGVAPFVAAGVGGVYYALRQQGEVLNEATLVAFPADLRSSGVAPAVLGAAGVDVSLSPRFFATAEARYTRARVRLDQPFRGFEPLDLSGVALTAGVAVRF